MDSIQVNPAGILGSLLDLSNSNHIYPSAVSTNTGKNKRFPFFDILGYLKNTHKNPKFGRVRQVPTRELGNNGNSLVGTCLTLPNLGFLSVFFKYPKISKNGNLLCFPVKCTREMETHRVSICCTLKSSSIPVTFKLQ